MTAVEVHDNLDVAVQEKNLDSLGSHLLEGMYPAISAASPKPSPAGCAVGSFLVHHARSGGWATLRPLARAAGQPSPAACASCGREREMLSSLFAGSCSCLQDRHDDVTTASPIHPSRDAVDWVASAGNCNPDGVEDDIVLDEVFEG